MTTQTLYVLHIYIYIWFQAQKKTKSCNTAVRKADVRAYGGYTINYGDILIAAYLHPDVEYRQQQGFYAKYNVAKKMIVPRFELLEGISQAGTRLNYRDHPNQSFKRLMSLQCMEFPS